MRSTHLLSAFDTTAVRIELTTNGQHVTLHLFSTGRIASRLSTNWQPIWVLAIDHPEGIFLVDTGIRTHITPWYYNITYKFDITRDQEIDHQLAGENIQTQQIKTILLTHRHFDHTGGLSHFPQTPVFHPAPKDLTDTCGPFTKARYLTTQKDLAVVFTPGHTRDHCSVLLKTDTAHILFAGDTSNNQSELLNNKFPSGLTIKAYAQTHPLVLLLTHDPESNARLQSLSPLPSSKTGNPPQPHP